MLLFRSKLISLPLRIGDRDVLIPSDICCVRISHISEQVLSLAIGEILDEDKFRTTTQVLTNSLQETNRIKKYIIVHPVFVVVSFIHGMWKYQFGMEMVGRYKNLYGLLFHVLKKGPLSKDTVIFCDFEYDPLGQEILARIKNGSLTRGYILDLLQQQSE